MKFLSSLSFFLSSVSFALCTHELILSRDFSFFLPFSPFSFSSSVFSGKHGFITSRDLFRWANRQPQSYQQIAEIGYEGTQKTQRREETRSM